MEDDCRKVEQVLCMNGGDGEGSYAKNSTLQRKVMAAARHILEESVVEVFNTFLPECLVVADLGCATGPNALLAVSEIISIVGKTCNETGHYQLPTFQVFLNDLPCNDFKGIFKSLPEFYSRLQKDERECSVTPVPGSFYGRLFPNKSLHFVHSSYAIHWLSQAPRGLISENGEALNKGNICIAETSSLSVHKAYCDQFKEDFTKFLKSRSEELMLGGGMVLTLLGSDRSNATFKVYEIIGQTLLQMATEDLIEESKLDTFNMPIHTPSADQIREAIRNEGSFNLRRLEIHKTSWDAGIDDDKVHNNKSSRGEFVAKYLRAVCEPLLAAAFGEAVMDNLFQRVAMKFTLVMDVEDCHYNSIVVWLTRKRQHFS